MYLQGVKYKSDLLCEIDIIRNIFSTHSIPNKVES